jgi:hypothetical protein
VRAHAESNAELSSKAPLHGTHMSKERPKAGRVEIERNPQRKAEGALSTEVANLK